MENKKIAALNELLVSLNTSKFDMEAWKVKASIVFKKLFGNDGEKALMIDQLQYNYSSWSLRDHSGGKQYDPVKTKAREIIEAAILELKLSEGENPVQEALSEHLSGKKANKLLDLIQKKDQKGVQSFISNLDKDTKEQLLSQILLTIA
jgi:hypothetical protein